jgi:hypothetical protein
MKIFLIKSAIIFFLIFVFWKLTFGSIINKAENKLAFFTSKEQIIIIKDKIRSEIEKGVKKDRLLSIEDAELLRKFLNKLGKEIEG